MVGVHNQLHADDFAVAIAGDDVDDAARPASLDRVFGERAALAVAVDAGGEHVAAGVLAIGDDDHVDDFIAFALEARSRHARDPHREQRIALFEVDRDQTVLADVGIRRQGGLLHRSLLRGEHEELLALAEIFHGQHVGDLLAFLEREQVGDRSALGRARHLRHVVHPPFVHAPAVGEEQEEIVRVGDEEVLDEVALFGVRPADAASAAALGFVGVDGQALDVTLVRNGDDDIFLRDQLVHVELADLAGDLGAAVVAVLFLHLRRVLADDVEH